MIHQVPSPLGGHDAVKPAFGVGAGDLVAGEAGDIEEAAGFADRAAFLRDDVVGVGAAQGGGFLEAFGREVEGEFEAP